LGRIRQDVTGKGTPQQGFFSVSVRCTRSPCRKGRRFIIPQRGPVHSIYVLSPTPVTRWRRVRQLREQRQGVGTRSKYGVTRLELRFILFTYSCSTKVLASALGVMDFLAKLASDFSSAFRALTRSCLASAANIGPYHNLRKNVASSAGETLSGRLRVGSRHLLSGNIAD
jgi:hypothetical protein